MFLFMDLLGEKPLLLSKTYALHLQIDTPHNEIRGKMVAHKLLVFAQIALAIFGFTQHTKCATLFLVLFKKISHVHGLWGRWRGKDGSG